MYSYSKYSWTVQSRSSMEEGVDSWLLDHLHWLNLRAISSMVNKAIIWTISQAKWTKQRTKTAAPLLETLGNISLIFHWIIFTNSHCNVTKKTDISKNRFYVFCKCFLTVFSVLLPGWTDPLAHIYYTLKYARKCLLSDS